MGALFVAGLSHHTAPVEVRERLALEGDKVREILVDLAGAGVLEEAMILATCNRVEVCGVAEVPGEAGSAVFARLGGQHGFGLETIEPLLYTKTEDEAVLHVFRVAASLDSMILGEPQILGQVKDAFALAQSAGTVGPVLHALHEPGLRRRQAGAHRDRGGPRSPSPSPTPRSSSRGRSSGASRARRCCSSGAGEMSELAARHLIDQGAHPVYVANRTWSRAQDLARAFAGTAVRFEDFAATMGLVDIVITSTAAPEPLVRAGARPAGAPRPPGAAALLHRHRRAEERRGRRERPRQRVLLRHRRPALRRRGKPASERQREAHRALAIVEREVERFGARLAELEVVPTIVSLRDKLEAIRRGELDARARPAARGRRGDAAGDGSAVAGDRQQGPAHAHRRSCGTRRARGTARASSSWSRRSSGSRGPGRRPDRGEPGSVRLRIGTRGSRLALVQTSLIAGAAPAPSASRSSSCRIRTSGDRLAQVALADFGGKALFVKEIEEALLEGASTSPCTA